MSHSSMSMDDEFSKYWTRMVDWVDFGVDECGEEFVEFGLMLPDGCYAVIEDGTYGQLQALRIYKEECHDD